MCAVIFKGKEMKGDWQLGVNIQAPLNPDSCEPEDNYGPAGRYSGAPKCWLRGKLVESFITCTKGGGITSQLLADMLKQMDDCGLFPREPGGPLPFLLVDGHGS